MVRPQSSSASGSAALAGDGGAVAALRSTGEVKVLEGLLRRSVVDRASEGVVEFALVVNALEDGGAALVELSEVLRAVAYVAELDFVEAGGRFLPIPGDERESVAFGEEGESARDLLRGERQLAGDGGDDLRRRHAAESIKGSEYLISRGPRNLTPSVIPSGSLF